MINQKMNCMKCDLMHIFRNSYLYISSTLFNTKLESEETHLSKSWDVFFM